MVRRVIRYTAAALALISASYLAPRGLQGKINYEASLARDSLSMREIADLSVGVAFVANMFCFGASFIGENKREVACKVKIYFEEPEKIRSGNGRRAPQSQNVYPTGGF